ncbi:MAG: gliding motility-associated C-terminal domain-containing protein [Endomicrobium sp.]|jgi:hypothetical protein|nr:gliding motility-associated C-terminal domain-containing protein [Endomicrobium sp.]
MNKKFIFSILIAFLAIFAHKTAYAAVIDGASPAKRFSVEISFVPAKTTVSIFHAPIERVSINMRMLTATGTVSLAGDSLEIGSLSIHYYTSDDAVVKTSSVSYQKTGEALYGFTAEPIIIGQESDFIYYRIIAAAKDGTEGKYPAGGYLKAGLYHTKSQTIGAEGGTLTLHMGDQRYDNTSKSFISGALPADTKFSVKEIDSRETLPYSGNLKPIIAYEFSPANFAVKGGAYMPSITLYYGDLPADAKNIEVRWLDGTSWERVNGFINETDMRSVTLNLAHTGTKLGYYGIFEKSDLTDSGYRPLDRAFRPGEFVEFRNLSPGDKVTIYNLRGQEISKADSGSQFKWDGKRDGSYVETGSYIYQIKVKGKVISGSLVFYR